MNGIPTDAFRVTIKDILAWISLMLALVGGVSAIISKTSRIEEKLADVDHKVSKLIERDGEHERTGLDHEFRLRALEQEHARRRPRGHDDE